MADRLDSYRRKRDFAATPEPAGAGGEGEGDARFVVQEHHARRLHWDLRLEREGALASWAVPRAIPLDPGENRLAVRTEDHPLEYVDFEGEIPEGQYGAGRMTIFDSGTYECEKWTDDKVEVVLHGERLEGRYALFRTKGDDWMIHRMDPPDPGRVPMPERVVPMKATTGSLPSRDEGWAYEIKWDGVRAIAYATPGVLRLESRNLNDITAQYPEVRGLLADLGALEAVLDGEIVAFDDEGRPSFEHLQRRMHQTQEAVIKRRMRSDPVTYVIFDLLHLDGRSLLSEPYASRRELLEGLELGGGHWTVPESVSGGGAELLEASRERGLEGLVAKRLDSRYEPGKRSRAWVKLKNTNRQELVIGGWVPGAGRRRDRLGALLVGHRVDGELRYAGRVGTGWSEDAGDELLARLREIETGDSPFAGKAPPRNAIFTRPELVCEVEFAHWTRDGMLRAPSYKGLRADADPAAVVREDAGPMEEETDRSTGAAPPPRLAELTAPDAPPKGRIEMDVYGRTLRISNPGKVLYPDTGFTKGGVVDYYARIAPVLLPHLRGRPLTLKRYPDGVDAGHFYEKRCPRHAPDWVGTVRVPSRRHEEVVHCVATELATLVWTANLASIELHPSLSVEDALDCPTALVFDLDPGAPAALADCCQVAVWLRGLFEQVGLESFPKVSGRKGLQLYVPLNSRTPYEVAKPFAHEVARTLEAGFPDRIVSRMTKAAREGKVLIDWSQNDPKKTTVAVYSMRAGPRPTVSLPVTWEEVDAVTEGADPAKLLLGPGEALERIGERGDLFGPVLSLVQRLPS